MSHPLFEQHRETLDRAVAAIGARTYFSAYPEVPSGKIYGEDAKAQGLAAFDAVRKGVYDLDQPSAGGAVAMKLGRAFQASCSA